MPGATAVFTIVAKNYLPYARVLMRSVAEHHPGWRRFVILTDQIDGYFQPQAEDFEIILSRDLRIPRSRWFHFKYTILELSTAVKPYAFQYLFERQRLDRILYLDPDIHIYSPMSRAAEMLESANIVLTPHLTGWLDDDKRPAEIDILRSGTYNLGFIGIAQSRESASFLEWWKQRLYDHCIVDLARGLFVDQKWVDLAPGMFEGVSILRHPGYNVAYWNLSHRVVTRTRDGYHVEGFPLVFFHYSGYDPDQPDNLSRHQNRFRMEDLPEATQGLLRSYREELLTAGYFECRNWPYAFGAFRNGVPIPDMGRPIHHEAPEVLDEIDDPFSDDGFKAFVEAWNSPVLEGRTGRPGISRLAYRIYRTRSDVQSAMPDIFGGDYRRFLEWMLVSGKREHGLGEVFLASIPDAIRTCKDHRDSPAWPDTTGRGAAGTEPEGVPAPQAAGGGLRLTRLAAAIYQSRPELQRFFPDPNGRDSVRFLAWLLTYGTKEHSLSAHHTAPFKKQWRSAMASLPSARARLRHELILGGMSASVRVRGILGRLPQVLTPLRRAQRELTGARAAARAGRMAGGPAQPREFGVNLVGYFDAATGVGQSVRGAYQALRAAAVPTSVHSAGGRGASGPADSTVSPVSNEFPYSTNLFYVNADQTLNVSEDLGEAFYRNRHNIGYWTWELEEFPDRYVKAFSRYQEIWTPSNFCRNAVGRKATIPVFSVPYTVAPEVPKGIDRQYFGLAPGRFVFLCAFDVLSIMERKNPIAAIRAFEKAFGPDSGCQLVLKLNNTEARPQCVETLREACYSDGIRIIDSTFTREEMYALTQCADCVVSLHRSEGFGLLIAEAMYLGKPVIVTNYSGNTDFTRPDNSLLVDYKLIPVGRNCEPYDPGSLWADPDVEQAAAHMAAIAGNADLRVRVSNAGCAFVRTALSPEAVGHAMLQRIHALGQAECDTLSAAGGLRR